VKIRVLITETLSPRAVQIFGEARHRGRPESGLAADELKGIIGAYDGLDPIGDEGQQRDYLGGDESEGDRSGRDRRRQRRRAAATARGIVVMNTPFGNSITTAEHAIAMIFALARQLPAANASTHAGEWEKSRFMASKSPARRSHHRLRKYRIDRRRPRAGPEDESDRRRPFPDARARSRTGRRESRSA